MNNNEKRVDDRLKHVAFIMDGNGRWAKKKGMPREYGHKVGAGVFEKVVRYCCDIGIRNVTVYAFSTENWKRPKVEVDAIMKLFDVYLEKAFAEIIKNDIRIVFIGDMSVFPENVLNKIRKVENDSASGSNVLNIAVNYGGRNEIVHAVNTAIKHGKTEITEKDIEENLYTVISPAPDLIVRTGGELRLSNFLLWQSSYSELYFTDTLWPDMGEKDIDEAVEAFYQRKRRYGNV
ncbi:MAG: di-trans,poly-cis-decaprenylcistransferase [Ruminococcaceae bacterium]|nr:di-trans,poly-cis-decaprenylcistransferase [Oscillospiraceae bacterium]